jgi:hypothetical protein
VNSSWRSTRIVHPLRTAKHSSAPIRRPSHSDEGPAVTQKRCCFPKWSAAAVAVIIQTAVACTGVARASHNCSGRDGVMYRSIRTSSQNFIGIGSFPSAPEDRRGQDDGDKAGNSKPIGTMRPWQERFVIVSRRREAALLMPVEAGAGQSDACAATARAYGQPQTATPKAIADASPR